MNLSEYARARDELLQRIVEVLEVDPRVRAAWLSGSFGRGEEDEWSDLDLHIAVSDAELPRFLAEREALYRRVGRPILIQEDKQSDSQAGARYQLGIYPGPVEVDWNIGPESQAQRPLAFRMLVERATIPVVSPAPLSPTERRAAAQHWLTFFWAMAPIGVKLCGRSDTRRAMQIDLLTTAFIALWRLIAYPNGPDPIRGSANRILEPELDARIPRPRPATDPLDLLGVNAALCAEVQSLHGALQALGVTIPTDMPAEVERLRAVAEEEIRRDEPRRLKYR